MSTSESKKKSSKKDEIAVEEVDESRKTNKYQIFTFIFLQVHTANDWEHADLGNDQRKQKFLRLMGAKVGRNEVISHLFLSSPRNTKMNQKQQQQQKQPNVKNHARVILTKTLFLKRNTLVQVRIIVSCFIFCKFLSCKQKLKMNRSIVNQKNNSPKVYNRN